MLFPLSKEFSSSGIFQRGGDHNERPLRRVWSVDHAGSKSRIEKLHLLLTDKKSYQCHENLAKKHAMEGKQQDEERMRSWKNYLRTMYERIDGEAEERREQTRQELKQLRKSTSDADARLRNKLATQAKDHRDFLEEMGKRVEQLEPLWRNGPPRESAERTQMRLQTRTDNIERSKAYKKDMLALAQHLDNRGNMEWTHVPRMSQDSYIKQQKTQGLQAMSKAYTDYTSFLERMEQRHDDRIMGERRQLKKDMREADNRLNADKTLLLNSLSDTMTLKKNELGSIQQRVENRPKGDPKHPSFEGYCAPGYEPVVCGTKRLREHAAERADRDASGEESKYKMLVLSVPLNLRNRVLKDRPPKAMMRITGSNKEWTEMSWEQRWTYLSTVAPKNVIANAQRNAQKGAGVDDQGGFGDSLLAKDQRTLSPRTLGLASAT